MIKAEKINEEGYFIFNEFLLFEDIPSEDELIGYVIEPLPADENGNQLAFYRPRWVNNEWVEDCTQEEIEEMLKPQPVSPTEMELLKEQVQSQQIIIDELLFEVIPSLLTLE